ncbi:MAG: hypothetical protein IPL27_06485 [Lewinellaceae bacterium]|nr:hypothetical protein [Lewinellaceae bacterium]
MGASVPGTGNAISFGNQPPGVGNYTVVATVVATSCTITMAGAAQVTAVNCRIEITDPCICLNNATSLSNGQFGEEITIFAITGQTWTLVANTGLYQPNGPTPPGAPVLIPLNTVITESPAGSGEYILNGVHVDDIGYSITVRITGDRNLPSELLCVPQSGHTFRSDRAVLPVFGAGSLPGRSGRRHVVSAGFFINGVSATEFDPAALGVGSYVIKYIVNGGVPDPENDDPGCIYTITRFVQVVATPTNLNCNDFVNVSLEADCSTEIFPDMVLEGTYGCFDDYVVEIDRTLPLGNGPWLPGVVNADDINRTYAVRVRHLVSGNSCWGTLKIEDKIPPVVVCENFDLPCNVPDIAPGLPVF